MKKDVWHCCYNASWKKILFDAAFTHPAKYSRGLINKIYKHLFDEGLLCAGDTVIDPFGGVACGAFDAMRLGLHWIGLELEVKFVELAKENIQKWNTDYEDKFKNWSSAIILQGDSRQLLEVIRSQADCCISSPSFGEAQRGGVIAISGIIDHPNGESNVLGNAGYDQVKHDSSKKNLGNLPATAKGFDAAISSPVYPQVVHDGNGIDVEKLTGNIPGKNSQIFAKGYGESNGQLAAMPTKGVFDASISSPPFQRSMVESGDPKYSYKFNGSQKHYGQTDGQIGNSSSNDFWSAARQIVQQTYLALKPGGISVWVVKSFVRRKRVVNFPFQWCQLCELVGFETLHEHHAMLIQDFGTQMHLDGGETKNRRARKSFFRRLSEKNGSPEINYEVVYCMMRPVKKAS